MVRVAAVVASIVLIAVTYGGTIGHEFVFDDRVLVEANPLVRESPWRVAELLRPSPSGASYRPVRVWSYQLDHAWAGGLDPAVFHASNVLLHVATVLVLLSLARVTIGSEVGAFAAAAIFAVHPLGSEAVAYVAGRRDILCTLFSLLALRAWWFFLGAAGRGRRGGSAAGRGVSLIGALVAMLLCAALAVGAKETAIVLPILALLLVAVRRPDGLPVPRARSLIGLCGATAALAAAAWAAYGDRLDAITARVAAPSLGPQPALTLRVLGRYAGLALWPGSLQADYRDGAYALPVAPLDVPSVLAGIGIAAVLGSGVLLLRRGAVAGVGLLWFLASLLPVAQFVPYGEVIAEHNAYLGIAGLSLAVGQGVAALASRHRRVALALLAVAVVVLAVRSRIRADDWRDDVSLWTATVESAPGSIRGRHNLGVALAARGRLAEARGHLEVARSLAPGDRDVMIALGSASARLGDHARARDLARDALAQQRDAAALSVLAWAELGAGNAGEAQRAFEEAIELGGDRDELARGLALSRRQQGRF